MEELLDKQDYEEVNHPKRIALIAIISAFVSIVIFIAGQLNLFDGIDDVFLFVPPFITCITAVIAAYPKNKENKHLLNNNLILWYSLLPFVYVLLLLFFISYINVESLNVHFKDLLEATLLFSMLAAIPSTLIASILIARSRALLNKSWIITIPISIITIIGLGYAIIAVIRQLD